MLEKFSEKIETIRQQPEYVRVKYVWICVVISMFVVLILWFFSIASMFAEEKNNSSQTTTEIIPGIDEQLQTLQEQAPSLKDLNDQSLTVGDEDTAISNEPQSNVYSDLQDASLSQ